MSFSGILSVAFEACILIACGRWLLAPSDNVCIEKSQFPNFLTDEQKDGLRIIAESLVTNSKGILAADESTGTIGKRFNLIKLENSKENRRRYRQLLFTTPNFQQYISGVILFEETFYQKTDEGVRFVDVLKNIGVRVGIKLDRGLIAIGESSEKISQGLDDLAVRAANFRKGGCTFAKWRSVFQISSTNPTEYALRKNAEILASFAMISQQEGLVPIIEPEVLADGNHSIEKAQIITERVLAHVYKALSDYNVYLEGTILKPNMVVPGLSFTKKINSTKIALATVLALRRTVPVAVPGIAFLSGGQNEEEATMNLKLVLDVNLTKPWKLTFSFGRALQTSALKRWRGMNTEAAQNAFLERAKANSDVLRDFCC